MIQEKKVSLIRISRHCNDHSFRIKHKQHSSIKKRPIPTIIHVNIGTLKDNCLKSNLCKQISTTIDNHHHHHHQNKQSESLSNVNSSIQISTDEDHNSNTSLKHKIYLSKSSSKVTPVELLLKLKRNENNGSDRNGMTNDHHQKPKTNKQSKCSRRCIIASIVATIFLVLIIVIILLAVLIKSKKTIKTTINDIPVLRWNSTGITIAGISSNPGSGNNQLSLPYDVILDYAYNLYIADTSNQRIQKYSFGTSTGMTIAGNGTVGSTQYQLSSPTRIILDENNNLYVSDTNNHRIQFWQKGAIYGTTVAGTTGSAGSSNNQLNSPYGIVLNPTSNTLYISNFNDHRIMSYASSGSNSGTLTFGSNGGGINNTQLYSPISLCFDSFSNSLVIVNYNAHNVVRYVLGESVWTLVVGDIGGSPGVTSTSFQSPSAVTFDPMGNVYVADGDNHRIQFFYANQLNGTTIAGITGVDGDNTTTLNTPMSLRLDNQLNLYVADTFNHRIQKFLRY